MILNLIKTSIKNAMLLLIASSYLLVTSNHLFADPISSTDKYAYAENAGWLNFSSTHEQATVYNDHLEGYVWSESVGWIRLGTITTGATHTYANNASTTYGVNNDGNGNLSGYAWSENAGWINFNSNNSQVTINATTGDFDGYAWSESLGWIHFQNAVPAYKVTRSISSIIYVPDSGNTGGSVSFAATGQSLSGISITTADGSRPANMNAPFGKISYQVTSPNNGFATVRLTFSTTLPTSFTVYKVDNGNYTAIPQNAGANGFWVSINANTIDVSLLDNGTFYLNNTLGVIDDPIAILAAIGATPIPTMTIWGLFLMMLLMSFIGHKKISFFTVNKGR